jgi:hypothetical protein
MSDRTIPLSVKKEQSSRLLKFGDIEGQTESTIVALRDQAINANYFKKKIRKKNRINAEYLSNMNKILTTMMPRSRNKINTY